MGTYVNDFPWNTMGGAMAAIMQKPMCICTKYHWKQIIWCVWELRSDNSWSSSIQMSYDCQIKYLARSYQVTEEKPSETESTVSPV